MILPFVSSLLFAVAAPAQPLDIRAVLVELTIANGISRECSTIETSGSRLVDDMACMLVAMQGVEVPPPGPPTEIKRRIRVAMVQFSDGSSRLATPPEAMMRRAFMRVYADGRRGVLIAEARREKDGARTCAMFAPGIISRFDAAVCAKAPPPGETADSIASTSGPALVWRNAVVAAGDL